MDKNPYFTILFVEFYTIHTGLYITGHGTLSVTYQYLKCKDSEQVGRDYEGQVKPYVMEKDKI